MEDKLRTQVAALLTPMLGEGNFSSEIQVELDMDQVTSARESYDKNGVVRSETQEQSQTTAGQAASGVPGMLSNTPPPPTIAQPGPPQGTPSPAASGSPPPTTSDSSSSRNYELGREVAVANTQPGKVKRISVAVALSAKAMRSGKAADVDQIKQLVSAAVGADPVRGDQVAVIARSFQPVADGPQAIYETPWFATIVRNGVALIAVLLVLLLGVRPLINALRGKDSGGKAAAASDNANGRDTAGGEALPAPLAVEEMVDPNTGVVDAELLGQQVGLAQRIAQERPEDAVVALRQMLNQPPAEPEAAQ
jgi:flagellar M-ring protein FliF